MTGTCAKDADGDASSVRGVQGEGCEKVPSDLAPTTGGTASPLLALRVLSLDDKTCTVETGASAKASAAGEEVVDVVFSSVAPWTLPEGEGGEEKFSSPDLGLSFRLLGRIFKNDAFFSRGLSHSLITRDPAVVTEAGATTREEEKQKRMSHM